jgi:hypothetical protein
VPVDYRLDDLGWYQFERLCQALLRAKYGAALEAWGGGKDFGRDAYWPGALSFPDPKTSAEGPFIFQAKFVSNANAAGAQPYNAIASAVRSEMERIQDRISRGTWEHPNHYHLLTNAPMGAAPRSDLTAIIRETLKKAAVIIHGATDLAASLDDSPAIRISYPQILGLRDLRALLAAEVNADIVNRSTISLDLVSKLAQVYVATEAYNQTLHVLDQHGFAVLTGPPEMGKTATAWMVALARFTSGWEVYDCRGPAEVFRVHKSSERQLFLADDAFGSTEYRPDIAAEWAAQLDRLVTICGPKHWIIWTSRPAPLRIGMERLHLQGVGASFPDPMQVQVDAAELSVAEKAQILYRHAKAAGLGEEAIELIKGSANAIVESVHFTPERIRRLVSEQMSSVMSVEPVKRREHLRKVVAEGLQEPSSAMRTSFNVLPPESRTLLVAMLNGSNRAMKLGELDNIRRKLTGRAPEESTEKVAQLIDDHFVRLEEWNFG